VAKIRIADSQWRVLTKGIKKYIIEPGVLKMMMNFGFGLMRKIEKLEPELKEVFLEFGEEIEKQLGESVRWEDFTELKDIVKDLAQAQKRTEIKVEELADAQKRTEIRVEELAQAQKRTEIKVEELAQAQKRTEIRVEELAEAQKRTEIKIEELVEAQKRTEKKVEELAQAQKQTADELRTLTKEHKKTREHLGGLSMGFGYVLENEAYKKLPELLERDFKIAVKGKLTRKYIRDMEGNHIEVNIFGHGEKDVEGKAKRVTIIGESKAQLSKNDVNNFLRKKIKRLEGLYEDVFMVLVTHMISSHDVEEYAKQAQIPLYYSYDF
jgi:chromosome segregation ATPase